MKKKVVILTGAGISAESGISTFRDAGGLWEGHDIMEVASPQGWKLNPELVTDFYNKRRIKLSEVEPNPGHLALKHLEEQFETFIVTQNVDDLHERAGSKNILHLHGELIKMRSEAFPEDIYEVGYREMRYGERCPKGGLLRPHIVWFGEEVPLIYEAAKLVAECDYLLVVGTSLEVYPAAGLVNEVPPHCMTYLVDPNRHEDLSRDRLEVIQGTAAKVLPELVNRLLNT